MSDSKWETSIGLMIVPQGGINLTDASEGFSNQSNVFAIFNVFNKEHTLTSFFSVKNTAGVAYAHDVLNICSNCSSYAVISKNVLGEGDYGGVGFTYSVGTSNLFAEVGYSLSGGNTSAYFGVFIPLITKTSKIKNKK